MVIHPQTQENEIKGKVLAFWEEFEKEIIHAKEEDCLVLIEMDEARIINDQK